MSLNSDFVGKIVTPKAGGGFIIGTAYPIRERVIITARHVIPDIKQCQNTWLRWEGVDDKKHILEILYESEDHDVVIAACETPPNVPGVIITKDRPSSTQKWTSFGYAKSAVDEEKKNRELETAGGTYFDAPKGSNIQQLKSKADVTDNDFWKGMSGAPIFTADTNHLTAIFLETSLEYETEEGGKLPVFDGRLRAASIAKLLEDDEFVKQVYGESYDDYKQRYKTKLQDYLVKLPKTHKHLSKSLSDCDTMLKNLHKDPIACIRDLKENCQPHLADNRQAIEQLFYLLLSQIESPCQWEGKHLHELNVSTHLYAELAVVKLYDVTPRLTIKRPNTLIGKNVIPASQKELGFDVEDQAKEQANAIAYALYKRWASEDLTEQALIKNPAGYEEVNEELILQREEDVINRFEINRQSQEAKDHPLLNPEVRDYIHKHLLADLPIVLYGESSVENEKRLQTHVRSFVSKILMSE